MTNPLVKYSIPVTGMNSQHCAVIISNALASVSGLTVEKVDYANQVAVIEAQDIQTVKKAMLTISDLGYGVTTKKVSFPVLEMSCAACAVNVDKALSGLPGVLSATVNYANNEAALEYLSEMITPDLLKTAVRSAGYDLVIPTDDSSDGTAESLERQRISKLNKKALGSLFFSLPVFIISMFFMPSHTGDRIQTINIVLWILATPVVFWFGRDFFANAWKHARHRTANMDTLVALSTGTAYVTSVFNTLYPFFWTVRGLEAHTWFEAASVVITFILVGKMLEEKAKGKTSSAIRKLMGLQPDTATVMEGSEVRVVPLGEVKPGDLLLIRPGDKIPVDGEITDGRSTIDESLLTGESLPLIRAVGDKVYAGTINQTGSLTFRASSVGSDTILSGIIRAVRQAQGSRAPVQNLVDKISAVFVPVVVAIAIMAFFTWWIFGGQDGLTHGVLAFVTVLVIACPCALGLATPTAIMTGIGKAAENGILVRDAESLESGRNVDTVVLDKTGTITMGKPALVDIRWLENDELLHDILYSLEFRSEHPLARAIAKGLGTRKNIEIGDFVSRVGLGISGMYNGILYMVGTREFLEDHEVKVSTDLLTLEDEWAGQGRTVSWFAGSGRVLAVMAVSDPVKPSSAKAVENLRKAGIEVHMLTGDNEKAAASVARQTGINHWKSRMLPDEKSAYIAALQHQGKIVAMAGDGINDSTALATADVSIAMAHGSDIAMDVAKMTIISSDISKIPVALNISRQAVQTIRQNLFWAFIYNIIGIPVAAGILYPAFGFTLGPMLAGAAMAMSSVSVVANSLRLRYRKVQDFS